MALGLQWQTMLWLARAADALRVQLELLFKTSSFLVDGVCGACPFHVQNICVVVDGKMGAFLEMSASFSRRCVCAFFTYTTYDIISTGFACHQLVSNHVGLSVSLSQLVFLAHVLAAAKS